MAVGLLLLFATASAQDISTSVYPSEDELYLALHLGELSPHQFETLQEIINGQIRVNETHLLDEIPNLDQRSILDDSSLTSLQREQLTGFLRQEIAPPRLHYINGTIVYRYTQELERDGRSRYRSRVRMSYGPNWMVELKLDKELSGRERLVGRRLEYRNDKRRLSNVVVGSFSARFGLGSLIGYHGKLVSASARIDSESLLVPDYGGFNGVYMRWHSGRLTLESLGSLIHDTDHRVATAGAILTHNYNGGLSLSLQTSSTGLTHRASGKSVYDTKVGATLQKSFPSGQAVVEFAQQIGKNPGPASVVIESKYRVSRTTGLVTFWWYADRFLDWSSGSKAGDLRRTLTDDETEFSWSDKRSGQRGVMVRLPIDLGDRVRFINSIIYARRDENNRLTQFISGLTWPASDVLTMRIDYLTKKRIRKFDNDYSESVRARLRLEGRLDFSALDIRSYVALNSRPEVWERFQPENAPNPNYLSAFVSVKYRTDRAGTLEFWSYWSDIEMFSLHLRNWYGYLRGEQTVTQRIRCALKLTHRYSHEDIGEHESTATLEVRFLP